VVIKERGESLARHHRSTREGKNIYDGGTGYSRTSAKVKVECAKEGRNSGKDVGKLDEGKADDLSGEKTYSAKKRKRGPSSTTENQAAY